MGKLLVVYGTPVLTLVLRLKNIFRAQLATCCVAVTDPDGAADLRIFRAAITDKTGHPAFNTIWYECIVPIVRKTQSKDKILKHPLSRRGQPHAY
jgi:hypothetical protein